MIRAGIVSILLVAGAGLSTSKEEARNTLLAWCLPDTTTQSSELQSYLTRLSTDTTFAPVRATLGIPSVSTDSITFLADEARCQRASAVMDSVLERTASEPVYLLTYGSYFAAFEPTARLGEFQPVFIFDSLMNVLGISVI